ncbi:MAG: tripartite tricarboxylate transporter TctB family protein [Deltaproteobacteria bacterium]|nr:tripartite tricarboxylate transporter TctB family protein [Deltaproteobacteria bacterium]
MAARKDLAFSICMVVLSIVLAVQSFRYPADSAFFPRVLSVLLLLLSLLLLFRAFRRPPKEDRTGGIRGNAFSLMKNQPVLVFGSTVLYVVMIPVLGFLVSTALFIFGSILFRDRRKLIVAAIYGICFSAALYFVFHAVLGVTLPRGWLL